MKPSFCDTVSCFSILNSKYFKLCMVGNLLVQRTDNYKGPISTLDKNSTKLSTQKGLTTMQVLQKNEYPVIYNVPKYWDTLSIGTPIQFVKKNDFS